MSILVAGVGNIGGFLSLLVARNPAVARIALVDPDVVEEKNVSAQAFDADDVGMPKVDAMAAKLRRIRPDLEIVVFRGELEDLPLGFFRSLVILALDSNGPRRVAARRTFKMGGRLLDCAVNGRAGLARVTELGADADAGCLECGWSADAYDSLPARHSCAKVPPTDSPAALGGLAASLAALRVLEAGRRGIPAETVEIVSTGAEAFRSVIPRNPECQFDHGRIQVEPLRDFAFQGTLGSMFDLLQVEVLTLPEFDWARKLRCERCAKSRETLRVARGPVPESCGACGGRMVRLDFYAARGLERRLLSRDDLSRSLADAGLEPGDLVVPETSRRGILLGDPLAPAADFSTQAIKVS